MMGFGMLLLTLLAILTLVAIVKYLNNSNQTYYDRRHEHELHH